MTLPDLAKNIVHDILGEPPSDAHKLKFYNMALVDTEYSIRQFIETEIRDKMFKEPK